MSTKRMIIDNHCDPEIGKIITEISMDDLEIMFKTFASTYKDFAGIEIHFDFDDSNEHDGMIEVKSLNDITILG